MTEQKSPSNKSFASKPTASRRGLGEVELRIIAHDGIRYALKLEQIFWKIIELAAASKKERVGAYLGRLFERLEGNENRTSKARVEAAEWLSNRLFDISAKSITPKVLSNLVQSIPLPCFCVDNDSNIFCQNEHLLSYLKSIIEIQSDTPDPTIRISIRSKIQDLHENLKSSSRAFVEDTISIRANKKVIERLGRIIAITTPQGRANGLFIILMP